VVSARDGAAARAALAAAGYPSEAAGDGTLVVQDERAVRRPDDVATTLVGAGCPPTRLAVEREDLETYFLRLVGAAPPVGGDGDG
jgi:ABC-2 type transport system ATP-binding protein